MGVDEKVRASGEQVRDTLPTVNPDVEKSQPPKPSLHPAFYVTIWISLSSSVILFNKWILSTLGFGKDAYNQECTRKQNTC
ncbi:hypothetical protein QC763_308480 [Podospora pseudopauciseta]|uniref:Uncharacterized protein n=2 Tax=Podospora TaxID=5144 RepID=A0ABR0HGZ4_9PEZI|nr:hypothetical protein QC763_308480 [Podospora pseudopauciseta]KAK4678530.1 hypothetical protein QC764_308480 [Podospora pseudoanserina]